MNSTELVLQLGVSGATLWVMLRIVGIYLPKAQEPVVVALRDNAAATQRLADETARTASRIAHLEGCLYAQFGWTPVDMPLPRQRTGRTPVQGVPTEYSLVSRAKRGP